MPSVTLMILGESLVPQKVSSALGISPDQQWQRGERKCFQRSDGSVLQFDSVHEWGGWKKRSSEEESKLELAALLDLWCSRLSEKKEALAEIRRLGCDACLDCCVVGEAESISLSPRQLASVADLGLALKVSFYAEENGGPTSGQRPTAVKCPPSNHSPRPAVAHP